MFTVAEVVRAFFDTMDMKCSVRQSCLGPGDYRVDVATREPLHQLEKRVLRETIENYRIPGERFVLTFGHVKGAKR